MFLDAILVTPRIINFRLTPAFSSLPLILSLCTMIFKFAILVTPRIINFRLATASASLRLMRSLRIYYSMLRGALLQLTALYVWFSYTVLSQLCPFSSRILPSHCSVCLVLVYCPLTALYVLFSYTALSLLCTFGSLILPSHRSVCLVLVYCTING